MEDLGGEFFGKQGGALGLTTAAEISCSFMNPHWPGRVRAFQQIDGKSLQDSEGPLRHPAADVTRALKGKLYRPVFSSPFPFRMHFDQCELEIKGLDAEDGWARVKFPPPQTY